jgi:hypothetical protein
MEDRTEEQRSVLKEKRNSYLWLFWIGFTILVSISLEFIFGFKTSKPLEATAIWAIGLQLLAIVYRVLTFCFNSFLAKIVKKRWKIYRLKGRVSPIYKLTNYGYYFTISKYSVEYTNLDLEWSIPFSTLFQEQEYILEGSYNFTLDDGGWKVEDVTNLEIPYKIKDEQSRQVEELINSAKTLEQQKIDNLNKTFNENFK